MMLADIINVSVAFDGIILKEECQIEKYKYVLASIFFSGIVSMPVR